MGGVPISHKIAERECPFCDYQGPNEILAAWDTPAGYGIYVVEPLRQITPGHVLVIPEVHVVDFAAMPSVSAETMEKAALWVQRGDPAEDCNLITSKGISATQSVFHLHIHVVPRRAGDGLMLPWKNPHEPSPPDLPLHKARPL